MKITEINKIITYKVWVNDNGWNSCYMRNDDGDWYYKLDYDGKSIKKSVDWELEKQLEELFQEEIGAGYMSESDCNDLYDADPNCKHKYDPNCYSGIKCSKCNGWYCL